MVLHDIDVGKKKKTLTKRSGRSVLLNANKGLDVDVVNSLRMPRVCLAQWLQCIRFRCGRRSCQIPSDAELGRVVSVRFLDKVTGLNVDIVKCKHRSGCGCCPILRVAVCLLGGVVAVSVLEDVAGLDVYVEGGSG